MVASADQATTMPIGPSVCTPVNIHRRTTTRRTKGVSSSLRPLRRVLRELVRNGRTELTLLLLLPRQQQSRFPAPRSSPRRISFVLPLLRSLPRSASSVPVRHSLQLPQRVERSSLSATRAKRQETTPRFELSVAGRVNQKTTTEGGGGGRGSRKENHRTSLDP